MEDIETLREPSRGERYRAPYLCRIRAFRDGSRGGRRRGRDRKFLCRRSARGWQAWGRPQTDPAWSTTVPGAAVG